MRARNLAALLLICSPAFPQGLRDAAERAGFLAGTAHSGNFTDAAYLSRMAAEYNLIQPENDLKFGPLRPAADRFNWARADAIVNFAAQNRMRVRGHVFVWHQQVAGWVTSGNFSPAQLSEILRQHILTVGNRYRGKVYAWDVVNEAFEDNGTLRNTVWYNQPGIGLTETAYIEQAFRWAREADPNALLFYNDYSAEWINAKSNAIFQMVSDFKARGVPIDGVGLQAHFLNANAGNLSSIDANIKRLTDLGLQVQFTEVDVRLPVDASGNATAAALAAQADLYGRLASVCLKYPLCTAFQTWGFTDKYSWIPGFFPGFGAALPFDSSIQPKGAYNALRDALASAPALSRPPLPAPVAAPSIAAAGLVNAASYAAGGISAGEIMVLFGASQGPPALVTASVGANGRLPTAAGESRLFFDGTAAPLLYSTAGQLAAIVPFGVAGNPQSTIQYEYQGVRSNTVTVPVVSAKPGLFTRDSSGKGEAAALDAGYAEITRAAPASRGSVVLLFLTGAGQTSPPGADGLISTRAPLPAPIAQISARIGGVDAPVLYAGGASGLVHGGIQLNIQVPQTIAAGDQPVFVSAAGIESPPGVTIAVK